MKKAIYLVWQTPVSHDNPAAWLQMSRAEFFAFLRSPEGKGRYFIHLTDDIDYEADEIYIEASLEEYQAWRKEYNAHLYLKKCQDGIQLLSLDAQVENGDGGLIDLLEADDAFRPDITVIAEDEKKQLQRGLCELPDRERKLLTMLYFLEKPMTERQVAEAQGISRSTVNYLKKQALKKLSEFLLGKSEKSQQ